MSFLYFFFFSLLKADELVNIELLEISLEFLFEREIQIVKVMKNYAIAIIKDGDGKN